MEPALIIAAVLLFLSFTLWNSLIRAPLRRSIRGQLEDPAGADEELQELLTQLREGAKTGPVLRKIKKRIASEPSERLRAAYLCAIGDVLRRTVSRRATALKYFVKALEADPTCVDARHGMRELLLVQRRGFKLEQMYWHLLSRLDFEADGCAAVLEVWQELAEQLEKRRSGRKRAVAIRRMLDYISEMTECEEEVEGRGGCSDR